MSFLKNILKPFVDFKEDDQAASTEKKDQKVEKISTAGVNNTVQVSPAETYSASVIGSSSTATGSAGANEEYRKYFENLVEEANAKNPLFQGTDFKEFIDSKIDVQAIADEETRYKTAFNVLKRTGLTKERLVTTGQEYIKLIDNDLKGFEDAFRQRYKSDVEQKEQALQEKATELKTLNDRVAILNHEMKQMSQEIMKSKDKLTSNKSAFVSAADNKKKEIQAELGKIAQYF